MKVPQLTAGRLAKTTDTVPGREAGVPNRPAGREAGAPNRPAAKGLSPSLGRMELCSKLEDKDISQELGKNN